MVILDGKRNDIGSTATAYAHGFLGRESPWGADALTVSPYLGDDSLQPFVEVAAEQMAGLFVLVKTSNPGGRMIQDLVADGKPIYRHVAEFVERLAVTTEGDNEYGAVGAVVGATYPQQLAELRAVMPHTWFLVPGFGSQGGTAADVAAAFDPQGRGAIVNNSRGIIFAHSLKPYKDRFARGAMAGGRGSGHQRYDCPTPGGNAGGKTVDRTMEEKHELSSSFFFPLSAIVTLVLGQQPGLTGVNSQSSSGRKKICVSRWAASGPSEAWTRFICRLVP